MTASSRTYGPINKTTFGETADGSVIRRMPNLVKFREDPDAMLVMSLEDYDEVTGKAAKAAIMTKDVVGKTPPITHVSSAEEGLLVSLNQRGAVDLPFIGNPLRQAESRDCRRTGRPDLPRPGIQNLANRRRLSLRQCPRQARRRRKRRPAICPQCQRPASRAARGRAARRHRRQSRLRRGYRKATSRHSPPTYSRSMPSSVPVAHLKKDAVWSIDADYAAKASVAATSEFGTARANGTWLLELALNMKSPTIYDTIKNGDREERVVNQEATMAAREKQKLIKERFRSWVFTDPDRTERLVRLYNDTYNNLRPRLFDGSHLDFPGMNQNIKLRPHQDDAVWRGMSSGNTLLAHAVGAGKTFTMAATGMKMKQAGLIKKPMYVVPNHLLEQFSREFMQLYPNARLLVAAKEDLTRDRRKFLTAKIASGEWDGIIVTHQQLRADRHVAGLPGEVPPGADRRI